MRTNDPTAEASATRTCIQCGLAITRKPGMSIQEWRTRLFCNRACYRQWRDETSTNSSSRPHATPEQQRAWRLRNIEKVREWERRRSPQRSAYNKAWRAKNAGRLSEKDRKARLKLYGLTLGAFEALLKSQDGKCAICHRPPQPRRDGKGRQYSQLDVDHNHSTNKVRALLCYNCNAILGHAHDSSDVLRSAIAYLSEHLNG